MATENMPSGETVHGHLPDKAKGNNLLPGRHLRWGLFLAFCIAVVAGLIVPERFELLTRFLIAWDVGLLVVLAAQWLIIALSSPKHVQEQSDVDDPGSLMILVISVIASAIGLVGAFAMLDEPDPVMQEYSGWIGMAIVIVAIAAGWLVIQTAYTLHYARLYYAHEGQPGGLEFLGGPPHDIDFAYFAFTIGMTFQVSDVTVTTRGMRKIVLAQSMVAFIYDLVVIALVINIVADGL